MWGPVAAGVAVALLAVGTYLLFVLSSSVSYRAGSGTYNDAQPLPGLSDVLALSAPSFQPYVTIFGETTFSFPRSTSPGWSCRCSPGCAGRCSGSRGGDSPRSTPSASSI